MTLTDAQVRHIAQLARLDLSDGEVAAMRDELATIVDYVEQLADVDTTDVEPVANVAGLSNVTRPDTVGEMFSPAAVLAHAPKTNQFAFLVPKAVER